MATRSRILLAVASLALLLAYAFPIWKITLEAPQYPEGIGMYIWLDTVSGEKPNDLKNINGLNHYIGMKEIVPETIPELKLMPWIIGFFLVTGLITAALRQRWMLYAWVALFLITAITGMVDFYLWEYDYGHNLDPTAAIKVPGMNYQPPLLGSKKLLNFTANSWPALGGIATFLSLGIGLLTAVFEWRSNRRKPSTAPAHSQLAIAVCVGISIFVGACTPEPQAINYGEEQCDHCRMGIMDERYGAELVTKQGKVYTFDSVECLGGFLAEQPDMQDRVHSLWVTDFQHPGTLIGVDAAFFLHSKDLNSPMGLNLTAFGPEITKDAVLNAFPGQIMDWNGVMDMVTAAAETPVGSTSHTH